MHHVIAFVYSLLLSSQVCIAECLLDVSGHLHAIVSACSLFDCRHLFAERHDSIEADSIVKSAKSADSDPASAAGTDNVVTAAKTGTITDPEQAFIQGVRCLAQRSKLVALQQLQDKSDSCRHGIGWPACLYVCLSGHHSASQVSAFSSGYSCWVLVHWQSPDLEENAI